MDRFSSDGVTCVNCSPGCNQCLNSTTCRSCASAYILSAGVCLLNCPQGTYNGGDKCYNCPEGCRTCNSAIDCRACNSGLTLYLGTCRTGCPSGTFLYGTNLCVACS